METPVLFSFWDSSLWLSLADPLKFKVGFWLFLKLLGPLEESVCSNTKQPHPKAAAGIGYCYLSWALSHTWCPKAGALRLWPHGSLVMANPGAFSSI